MPFLRSQLAAQALALISNWPIGVQSTSRERINHALHEYGGNTDRTAEEHKLLKVSRVVEVPGLKIRTFINLYTIYEAILLHLALSRSLVRFPNTDGSPSPERRHTSDREQHRGH